MLTKTDLKAIRQIVKEVAVTKEEAKNFATKEDLKNFATKDDLKELAKQKDLLDVKEKLEELSSFSQEALGNIFEWTDDIHQVIVRGKSPLNSKDSKKVFKS